jgi:hypothetical protein
VHELIKEMFQSQIEHILLPSTHNDSTTTTIMEPAPPIKDGSIKDPTYHERIVIGYTVDQQGQNIGDKISLGPIIVNGHEMVQVKLTNGKRKARSGVLRMKPVCYAGRQDLSAKSAHAHTETI